MFRTKISAWDVIVSGAVILVAALMLLLPMAFWKQADALVIRTPEGSRSYSLSENREITLTSRGVTLTVKIENGAASVIDSSCPDGVCLAGGSIRYAGESILCAPAGVTLIVIGGDGNVDFVAG